MNKGILLLTAFFLQVACLKAQCPLEISFPIGIFAPFKQAEVEYINGLERDRIKPGVYTGIDVGYAIGKNQTKWIATLNLAYHLKGFTTYHSRDIAGVGFSREELVSQRYIHILSPGASLRKQLNNHSTRILAFQAKFYAYFPFREEMKNTMHTYRALNDEVTEQISYVVFDYLDSDQKTQRSFIFNFSPALHYEHQVSPYLSWLFSVGPALTMRIPNTSFGYNWLWSTHATIGFARCFPPRSSLRPQRQNRQSEQLEPIVLTW